MHLIIISPENLCLGFTRKFKKSLVNLNTGSFFIWPNTDDLVLVGSVMMVMHWLLKMSDSDIYINTLYRIIASTTWTHHVPCHPEKNK